MGRQEPLRVQPNLWNPLCFTNEDLISILNIILSPMFLEQIKNIKGFEEWLACWLEFQLGEIKCILEVSTLRRAQLTILHVLPIFH